MQRENISSFPSSVDSPVNGYAVTAAPSAQWRQLLPAHRLPVIAKSPFIVALGVYMSGGRFDNPAVGVTMLLAGALWATLYAINESTDLMLEHRLAIPGAARRLLFALCVVVCMGAFWLSPVVGILCAGMAVGQLAYCEPPLRLKRHWWAALLLSGMLNPVLRLECGAHWGAHAIPPLVYLVFVSLHVGASLRSRALLRERDRKLSYKTIPMHAEQVGMACTAAGIVGAYGMCWQGVVPRIFVLFVTAAAAFSLYAWSGRVTNVSRLRQGWLWFAILAPLLFALLYFNRS